MMYMTSAERVCSGFVKKKEISRKNISEKEQPQPKMATLEDVIKLMWAIKLVQ